MIATISKFSQEDIYRFARSDVPADVLRHPGMISEAERRTLFGLTQLVWRGGSTIIDAGAFLGASTKIFCEALANFNATTGCVYSYEYGIFNAYNAKVGSDLLGRGMVVGAGFDDLLQTLVADARGLVRYHIGDVQNFPYDGTTISLAFLDILKSATLTDYVYSNFFPSFDERTLLYQQDYFHPAHPWIACSMAKFADAFVYVGQPEPESGAFNSAIFVVKDQSKIPRRVDEFKTASKGEILDYMSKAIAMHERPIERLNVIGLRSAAEAAFDHDETRVINNFRHSLLDYGLASLADDSSQRHHVTRILKTIKNFSQKAAAWS